METYMNAVKKTKYMGVINTKFKMLVTSKSYIWEGGK